MNDPYSVLGVSRSASMDEIKKAYRSLSRKYHPDANVNNPNKDQAEERFKLIQQAYQQIVNEKEHGGSSYGYEGQSSYGGGYGGSYGGFEDFFTGFGGQSYNRYANQDQEDPKLRAALNYINSGHLKEAMNVLNDISERGAKWYYLRAIVNARSGNNVAASEDAKRACDLEPDNMQYRQLYQSIINGNAAYTGTSAGYGTDLCGGSSYTCSPCCCPCMYPCCCFC